MRMIPGYSHHAITRDGRVYCFPRRVKCCDGRKSYRRKSYWPPIFEDKDGYLKVKLDGGISLGIHRLLYFTYVGPIPKDKP